MPKNLISSASAHPCAEPTIKQCTYLAIRPTVGLGQYTASAHIAEYHEVHLDLGLPDAPAQTLETYDTAEAAIDAALETKAQHPHLRVWYDGRDDLVEIFDWRSLSASLAEWTEEWAVVEQVATGLLAPDDPAILDAADYIPLIAVAAQKVRP